MAFHYEEAVGHSLSDTPRECILCHIFHVQEMTLPHCHTLVNSYVPPGKTIQMFKVDPSQWRHEELLYPENIMGFPNGVVAPFLKYNPNLVCELNKEVCHGPMV